MTSSKAISTSRKRTRRSLIFLFLILVLLLPAFAGEYRIGLVQDGENSRIGSMLEEAFAFSSSIIGEESLAAGNSARLAFERTLSENIARDEALRAEKPYTPTEVKKDDTDLVGKVIPLELDETTIGFLRDGDKDAVEYIKYREKLDELVFISILPSDGLVELSITIDGEEILFELYSEMLGGLEKKVLPVLLEHYRGKRYQLLKVNGNVGANITENGVPVEKFSSYVVLTEGLHTLRFEQTGYSYYTTIVDVDSELESISYSLEKDKGEKLFISSRPYPDSMVLNGIKLDSLFSEEASLPFTLTVMKDGFVPRTVQSARPMEKIELQLLPTTFYDRDKLGKEKKSFYSHLLSTLLSFGVSVASETLDRMLPETDLSLVTAGLYGLTTTGVVMMIDSLFDYKNALSRSY